MTKKKKNLLQEYIESTNSEINERILSSVSKLLPTDKDNIELIASVDNDIKPLLVVLISDTLNGNHEKAINNAALYKCKSLFGKGIESGAMQPGIPNINIFDVNSITHVIQNIPSILDLMNTSIGSLVECYGRNMNQGYPQEVLEYSIACTTGANCSNNTIDVRDLGICIGKLYTGKKNEDEYNKFLKLIKKLPNNKHRKRLQELVKSVYESSDELISDVSPQIKPNHTKSNQDISSQTTSIQTTSNNKEKSSLKELLDESNSLSDKIMEQCDKIKDVLDEERITFIVEDDTNIVEQNKRRKSNTKELKTNVSDTETRFATEGNE